MKLIQVKVVSKLSCCVCPMSMFDDNDDTRANNNDAHRNVLVVFRRIGHKKCVCPAVSLVDDMRECMNTYKIHILHTRMYACLGSTTQSLL